MIRIRRAPEADACPELPAVRDAELGRVRDAMHSGRVLDQKLLGDEYKVARLALAKGQHLKCCYCEDRLQDARWEHVEHFRPKAEARRDSSSVPETGYWWLTWTWENLLFSCIRCNAAKGSDFPLLEGSTALVPGQDPPAAEQPALIDPAEDDPREHVQFRRYGEHWIPGPRTSRGALMLRTVDLGLEPEHEGAPRRLAAGLGRPCEVDVAGSRGDRARAGEQRRPTHPRRLGQTHQAISRGQAALRGARARRARPPLPCARTASLGPRPDGPLPLSPLHSGSGSESAQL